MVVWLTSVLLRCLRISKGENEDETTGIHIVARAIEEPLRQIARNAGVDGSVIIQKIREGKGDFGYNARTDEYVNMFEAGVIDPTKVSRVALENAASVAKHVPHHRVRYRRHP